MSIPTLVKYAIGAAAVAIIGYGAYRGYKSAKAKISVEERNKRALQMASNAEHLRALAKAANDRKVVDAAVVIESPEAQQMLEAAVEVAKETYDTDDSVRKLSFRTGGIVSPDTIIKTQVTCANDLSATEQQVRLSFYTAVVAFGSQSKDPVLTFEESFKDAVGMILDNHCKSGALRPDELAIWSNTVKPFHLPSVELVRKLLSEMDRGQVITTLAQMDLEGTMEVHVTAVAPVASVKPVPIELPPVSTGGSVTMDAFTKDFFQEAVAHYSTLPLVGVR